jgi:hypothetical protein
VQTLKAILGTLGGILLLVIGTLFGRKFRPSTDRDVERNHDGAGFGRDSIAGLEAMAARNREEALGRSRELDTSIAAGADKIESTHDRVKRIKDLAKTVKK